MKEKIPGNDGNRYVPYAERTGNESIVYFTRDLSAAGLRRIYERVNGNITGKVGVKLHTGEAFGPNILPRAWVREFIEKELPDASVIETTTYYAGDRDTTEKHLKTLKINGWTFCPVDIMDAEGTVELPVPDGKWFDVMTMGKDVLNYDSVVALTHFKGHTKGGFGGSNKNLGIGMADGKIGKRDIHTTPGSEDQWDIGEEEFMERMTESTAATLAHFGKHITFVNVMRNISCSCDCEGCAAEPVVTPDIGIVASADILAADQACVDLIYALSDEDSAAMRERMESRHGLRQLSYMKEMGMGNDRYILIDIDKDDARIQPADAVVGVKPFVEDPIVTRRRVQLLEGIAPYEGQ